MRDSNIELLRIVAMFLIVISHLGFHSNFPLWDHSAGGFDPVLFAAQNYCTFGKLGVDIFVIITGYFLVVKTFKVSSLIKIWGVTFFYSILFFIISLLLGYEGSSKVVIHNMLPISFHQYWFITAYFILILFSPLLGGGLNKLSHKQYRLLLLFLVSLFGVIPSLSMNRVNFFYSELMWFVVLFSIGGYIRKYVDVDRVNSTYLILVILISVLLNALWIFYCHINGSNKWFEFSDINDVPWTIASVSIFIIFCKFNIGRVTIINKVASCVLAVYLIHDNNYVRVWLWKNIFRMSDGYDNSEIMNFIIISVLVSVLVFASCVCIDCVRKYIANKLILNNDRFSILDKYVCSILK